MWRRLLPTLAALTLLATGCAANPNEPGGKPWIVTGFYPLQFIAEEVAGDHAHVVNLTPAGVEPHDLDLSPKQAITLADADVAFYERDLSPAVDQVIANNHPRRVVEVGSVIRLHDAPSGVEGTDHDNLDPHFWQDPVLVSKVAAVFTAQLSSVDPSHAADYRKGLDRLQTDLASLDTDFRTGLAHCQVHTIVTSHDAFEYLGRRYGMNIAPIAGVAPDAEPSARYLHDLAQIVRKDKVTTVFSEELASPKLADALARELNLKTAVLDPIEGLSAADTTDNYLTLMRKNLREIQEANSCRM